MNDHYSQKCSYDEKLAMLKFFDHIICSDDEIDSREKEYIMTLLPKLNMHFNDIDKARELHPKDAISRLKKLNSSIREKFHQECERIARIDNRVTKEEKKVLDFISENIRPIQESTVASFSSHTTDTHSLSSTVLHRLGLDPDTNLKKLRRENTINQIKKELKEFVQKGIENSKNEYSKKWINPWNDPIVRYQVSSNYLLKAAKLSSDYLRSNMNELGINEKQVQEISLKIYEELSEKFLFV